MMTLAFTPKSGCVKVLELIEMDSYFVLTVGERHVQHLPRTLTKASIFVVAASIQDLFFNSFLDFRVGQNSLKRKLPFSVASSFLFELSIVETTSCHLFTTLVSR